MSERTRMRHLLVTILCLFFTISVGAEYQPKSITIGFTTGGDAAKAKEGAVKLAEKLQAELGVPVNVFIPKDYQGLIEALSQKKIDFAFLTATTFVESEKTAGVKVLLKKIWKEPFYYSQILVPSNSKAKKLQDLQGLRVAFVDTKSTSGYLYPMLQLKKQKIDVKKIKEIKMSGSHSESVQMLDRGDVDAIAVFSDDIKGLHSAYVKYSKKENAGKKVRILWTSDAIPNDPFCVRNEFYEKYPKLTHTLMFALIDIVDQFKNEKALSELFSESGFVPATSKQYDSVRDLVKQMADLKGL